MIKQQHSVTSTGRGPATSSPFEQALEWAHDRIGSRAADLDRTPRFPEANFADLQSAGLLAAPQGGYAAETRLVRLIAAADASTARILDGHLNGLERLALADAKSLPGELEAVRRQALLLGVWGADPAVGEGPAAQLKRVGRNLVIDGVKTFCSGAGKVDRALVVARGGDGDRRLVYVDATDSRVEIDRGWYSASGLRSSESHRVIFREVPVLAVLGDQDELTREPYFSRDAIRTTATWAGLVDAIMQETTAVLGDRYTSDVELHGLGRMRVAAATIDRWLDHTVRLLADSAEVAEPSSEFRTAALQCRIAISEAARMILTLAAQICGARALIGASRLDRARRDLDLFLLQHRLDSKITLLGSELVDAGKR
jgi:alkylation response protein AidB-like acyl-CoA dehydrogenase